MQVGSHIVQRHGMTAREYREQFDFPVKKGIICQEYRQKKAKQALENGTYKNLEAGKPFRYDKRPDLARLKNVGWKGRNGSVGYVPDEFYG